MFAVTEKMYRSTSGGGQKVDHIIGASSAGRPISPPGSAVGTAMGSGIVDVERLESRFVNLVAKNTVLGGREWIFGRAPNVVGVGEARYCDDNKPEAPGEWLRVLRHAIEVPGRLV